MRIYIFVSKCGTDPKKKIMDGLSMGGRRYMNPELKASITPIEKIKWSTLEQQVFVTSLATRKLLSLYANLCKDGRYKGDIKKISDADYNQLCDSLETNPSLQDVIRDAGNPCIPSLRKLAGELSRNSPICGMLQIAAVNNQAYNILSEIADGDGSDLFITVFDNMVLLQKSCSLLIDFLLEEDILAQKKVRLLKDLLKSVKAPFKESETNGDECYGPINESDDILACFPNNPLFSGKARYYADGRREELLPGCRKKSLKHQRLNPGLFTVFCPHKICLGFQLMVDPESPRIPFDILMTRFEVMPEEIIYDNCCNLHRFTQLREPVLFQDTRFMVDRFHFDKNHVGCSLGYDLDTYSADEEIATLNSQVCEQANKDLRNLSIPFAYASPTNVVQQTKVFLAIRNMSKK